MIIRPRSRDHLVVGFYTGKVIVGVGALMLIPLVTSLLAGEFDVALDFLLSIAACVAFGYVVQGLCATNHDPTTAQGMAVAAGSWIFATALSGIPLLLSGHTANFLDAAFDAMSGYTTTGLFLLQDLDHVSVGLNMWRHVMTFAGGQGIVVLALGFLFKGAGGSGVLYLGEARDERLLPNISHTARAIGVISISWLFVGGTVMALAALFSGQSSDRAILHGYWMFMGSFSTGGFAPTSFNALFYHSLLFEIVTMIVFYAGSLNFALHWSLWHKGKRVFLRDLETVSFACTLTLATVIVTYGLAKAGVYPETVSLFRKGFYQVFSGHTTTGMATIYSRVFITQWGPLGMIAVIIAMMLGGSACSTAGGIKALRVGLITKTFLREVRAAISPRSALIVGRYNHLRESVLEPALVRTVLVITVAYLTLYGIITVAGVFAGYPLLDAAFEGVSAASNSGLSCGLLTPATPAALKIAYTAAMWLGRLEFMSVFALFGWVYAMIRGS